MEVKQMILLFLLLPMWGLPPATTYQINKCNCIEQGKPYQVHMAALKIFIILNNYTRCYTYYASTDST